MIIAVGMGRKAGDLTLDGAEAIAKADVVVVKSRHTHAWNAVSRIRSDALSCDDLYLQAADFDELNESIIRYLHSFGSKKVAFCVVGEGSDDTTVQKMDGVKVVCGVPLHGVVAQNNFAAGTAVYTAAEFLSARRILPRPTVVKCIDDKYVASEVQLKLLTAFDVDAKVVIGGARAKQTTVGELLRHKFDYQTTIYVFPGDLPAKEVFDYYDCADVLQILRSEHGCPWDREQTHKSIIKNVIEEAYELANALQNDDLPNVVEELGDLLMQVLFHVEIAEEDGEFTAADVYTALCRKLIDRHPHVFGNVAASTAEQSLDVWNAQKRKEHKINDTAQNVLDVPVGMSALMRNQKIQSRAAKGGYEFESVAQMVSKVQEELQEFLQAQGDDKLMEGGDLLHAVVSLLRMHHVDAESALLASTDKFVRRVVECERLLSLQGKQLPQLTMEQFDEIWAEVKRNVG